VLTARASIPIATMIHAPGFLKVVNETRPRVREITVEEARSRLARNPHAALIDVREDHEWAAGHAAEAEHLGRGVLERDIERLHPDPGTELLLYCGGGFRSVLAADMAQRMGYTNVHSIIGGWKAMTVDGWPAKSGA
jgi:rhodanese-related sulfurtransferase